MLGRIGAARAELPPLIAETRASRIYETAPWGYTRQPAFLNQVIEAHTDLAPLDLLSYIKSIEVNLGRTPTFRYGPRLIDIDIIFYGDQVMDLPGLVIPHPLLEQRPFVLVPLAELAPQLHHPVNGQTMQTLVSRIDTTGVEVYPG